MNRFYGLINIPYKLFTNYFDRLKMAAQIEYIGGLEQSRLLHGTIASVQQTSHRIYITSALKQMCKHQDQTYQGIFKDADTGEEGRWGMITDGHGTSSCIRFLRGISQEKLDEIMGTLHPVENLAELINVSGFVSMFENSGATMCLVKVYNDRIVCINAGDSQAAVYRNGKLEFLSQEHTPNCPSERARLNQNFPGIKYTICPNIQVIQSDSLIQIESEYAIWPSKLTLACTQALGHRGQTGFAPDVTVIPYGPGENIQVVIGSDGLWDIVLKENQEEIELLGSQSSQEIVDFARDRWMQEWNQAPLPLEGEERVFIKCRYVESETDDIGVVKIDIVPV